MGAPKVKAGFAFARALPKNVHLVKTANRTSRACGSPTGGFIRIHDKAGRRYLTTFLQRGGGLCPECAKHMEGPTT